MNLQLEFEPMLSAIPDVVLPTTFLEIAGYPHYENVCSNILKFYLNPASKQHNLKDLLLKSLLKAAKQDNLSLSYQNLTIKREYATSTGRIDLVLIGEDWVIGIENKIRHYLNNDLEEYAFFLSKEFPRKKPIKIVLSLKDESENLKGGFVNVTYKALIGEIENALVKLDNNNNEYTVLFQHFIQTLKNQYMPVKMEKSEIDFLIQNQEKIEQLVQLEDKFNAYINQRANEIKDAVKVEGLDKWVYANYDVGFHYTHGDVRYKIECPIEKHGIYITICVEINKIDKSALERLEFFKNNNIEKFEVANNRLIIDSGIPFEIDNASLVAKLEKILKQIKIVE